MVPIVLCTLISTILYFSWFVSLSNYQMMIWSYGIKKIEGFYFYHSTDYPYYDSISTPLNVYSFEALFALVLVLGVLLASISMILFIDSKKHKS